MLPRFRRDAAVMYSGDTRGTRLLVGKNKEGGVAGVHSNVAASHMLTTAELYTQQYTNSGRAQALGYCG